MADNRKSFRARRLAFGGRILPRALILAAALASFAAAGGLRAEEAGLKNGAASLAAGKYDAAVRQLSATINSDSAAPGDAAKALYLRGIAYRKMGEPARAAADLGAAIWLGLPETDRVKALVNRGLAYQAAGLSREGETELAAARKLGGSGAVDALIADGGGAPAGAAAIAAFATEVRPEGQTASSASSAVARNEPPEPAPTRTANASPGAWDTSVADQSQPASSSGGNRLTRWFGSLTNSSAPAPAPESAPAPQAAATPQPVPKPAAPPAAAASSSWSTSTETQEASSAGAAESNSRWRIFGRTAAVELRAATGGASFGRRRLSPATRHQPL